MDPALFEVQVVLRQVKRIGPAKERELEVCAVGGLAGRTPPGAPPSVKGPGPCAPHALLPATELHDDVGADDLGGNRAVRLRVDHWGHTTGPAHAAPGPGSITAAVGIEPRKEAGHPSLH